MMKEVALASQRYREAVSASQEEVEDNNAGEETPAQVRRKLEEEIKELTEKRENALEESGRLLELYTVEKAAALPEEALMLKRKADGFSDLVTEKRTRLDDVIKKHFK